MSVFHTFYLSSNIKSNFDQLKKKVIEFIPKIPLDIAKGRAQVYENNNDVLRIWCEYFSLSIKIGGQSVKNKSEEYGIDFHYQFWFDIYTESPRWLEEILMFIGKIMLSFDGDCILESNGEQLLLIRKDNNIVVDGKKLYGAQKFPFESLGLKYKESNLESV